MFIPFVWLVQARKIIIFLVLLSVAGLFLSIYRFKPWQDVGSDVVSAGKGIDDNAFMWTQKILEDGSEYFKSNIDVFSSIPAVNDNGDTAINVSTGQLPDTIKIVAVLRGAVSTLVLEDTVQTRTIFLEEKKAQGEYLLKSVDAHRAILMYQGQLIEVPLK